MGVHLTRKFDILISVTSIPSVWSADRDGPFTHELFQSNTSMSIRIEVSSDYVFVVAKGKWCSDSTVNSVYMSSNGRTQRSCRRS